ncbi:MAG: MATE family efflux transporter [Thermodesulfobacteriota bacterium]
MQKFFDEKNANLITKTVNELHSIFRLALPLLLTQLGFTVIGFIDTMMAGHYSKTALAGAAVGSSIFFPFVIAMSGIMMAVVPVTAQLKGRGQQEKAFEPVKDALWISFVSALVLIFFFNNTDFILEIMQISDEVADVVKNYLIGVSIGMPAAGAYLVLKSFVEGLGNTKPQMFISFICVCFNYAANDILIHGKAGFPEMGGAGCGWATGLTFWIFLLSIIFYCIFNKECSQFKIFSNFTWPSLKGSLDILKLGLPIGGTLFMECSIFACITLFIGVLGPAVVGGHQITLNYSGLIFSIPLSIGMAVTIRTGHSIGSKDPYAARFSCIIGSAAAILIAFITLVFTRLYPELIASFYTTEPDVIKTAVVLLKTAALYQVSDALMITCQSALRGYKDTNVTFLMTFTAYWIITLPLGYIISMTDIIISPMGAQGFWISLIVGLTISGILLSLRLKKVSNDYILKFSGLKY